MEIALIGVLPAGLKLQPSGKHEHADGEVLGEPRTREKKGGKISINEKVEVSASNPDELPEYLTAERKRAALRLCDATGELEGSVLTVMVAKHVTDVDALDDTFEMLVAVAPVLDTA